MAKNKLQKFADMETYSHVFQYPFAVLKERGFDMRGKWNEMFFHNDNPIVLELGCGNTFTNMRIARVQIGVKLIKGGNYLRNIHPLYSLKSGWDHYESSVAFYDDSWENWYDFCYSDQYATGFYMKPGLTSIYHNCFCFWWKTLDGGETGFRTDGKFCSILKSPKVTFRGDAPNTNFLIVGEKGGNGIIETPTFNEKMSADKSYKDYLFGPMLDR